MPEPPGEGCTSGRIFMLARRLPIFVDRVHSCFVIEAFLSERISPEQKVIGLEGAWNRFLTGDVKDPRQVR